MAGLMDGRVALVTGASRGLGYAIALRLASEGAHIIATARTQAGLEELDDAIRAQGAAAATLVPANLTDFAAIDRLGAHIFERWRKLDIMVGNAGQLGKLTPLPHLDPRLFDEVMAVNVTANYRLIRSMDPLLKASGTGRAVFITSGVARRCPPYWGPYAISKAALEAMVATYAQECASSSVRVNCYSPGATRTAMRAKAMPGEDPTTLPSADDVATPIIELCGPSMTDNGLVFRYAAGTMKQEYSLI